MKRVFGFWADLTETADKAMFQPMAGGRPTNYQPEFCDGIVEYMGQGFSKTAFAGHIGVCHDTIIEWAKVHPEFSDAVKRGKAARTSSLERGLLENELGPKVTARIFALKNASPEEWRDRHEVTGADGGPLQVIVQKFSDEPSE